MSENQQEERIALFLDYDNLAIGAREEFPGMPFDFRPIADALAERGRVVVRRAYADWSQWTSDLAMLTQAHVELIEIPQRLGVVRKNAADIKMAVDAMELAFERDYITTFAICTGDSDFTPLVHKLRELNKKVIGVGVQASTSALLPPACDEFLFYERLEGVDLPPVKAKRRPRRKEAPERAEPETVEGTPTDIEGSMEELVKLVTRTLAGMQRSSGGGVRASGLKRAILRKDPTFNEADYGFRAFGELLRHLQSLGVVELKDTPEGDPIVDFPAEGREEEEAFELLRLVVAELEAKRGEPPVLSGLKDQLRKKDPSFSEKRFGFSGFLQFVKAADARGYVDLRWDDEKGDYVLRPVAP